MRPYRQAKHFESPPICTLTANNSELNFEGPSSLQSLLVLANGGTRRPFVHNSEVSSHPRIWMPQPRLGRERRGANIPICRRVRLPMHPRPARLPQIPGGLAAGPGSQPVLHKLLHSPT